MAESYEANNDAIAQESSVPDNRGRIGEERVTSNDPNNNAAHSGTGPSKRPQLTRQNSIYPSVQELEEWQILDAEDQQVSGEMELKGKSLESGSKIATKSDTKTKKYVDIDPLALQQRHYSPKLVFLCTAIYSLLPVASTAAFITLVTLLFTRFYYISLLYFAYVFYDRKTCNKG